MTKSSKTQLHSPRSKQPLRSVHIVGTGSYLPQRWTETYATADIVEYDGKPLVKVGREFLLRRPTA